MEKRMGQAVAWAALSPRRQEPDAYSQMPGVVGAVDGVAQAIARPDALGNAWATPRSSTGCATTKPSPRGPTAVSRTSQHLPTMTPSTPLAWLRRSTPGELGLSR
jgi:hypothetical protein